MRIVEDMKKLVSVFAPMCPDRTTMDELARMLDEPTSWHGAHSLFDRIRQKNLQSQFKWNRKRSAQYCFEEVCAQTLFNFVDTEQPFDLDAPYWIVPNAFALARALEIDEAKIVAVVAAD
jgi:hypothetical protein